MKNLLRKALLLLCALMLAASMTACGSDKSEDTKDKTEDTAKDETEEADETDETEADDSSDGGRHRKILTRWMIFVKSDIMQEQLETQIAALEGTGISADVYADGDTLVYDFTIEDEAVASVMDKATLDSSLQSQASTFEGVAAMLPAAIENIDKSCRCSTLP